MGNLGVEESLAGTAERKNGDSADFNAENGPRPRRVRSVERVGLDQRVAGGSIDARDHRSVSAGREARHGRRVLAPSRNTEAPALANATRSFAAKVSFSPILVREASNSSIFRSASNLGRPKGAIPVPEARMNLSPGIGDREAAG